MALKLHYNKDNPSHTKLQLDVKVFNIIAKPLPVDGSTVLIKSPIFCFAQLLMQILVNFQNQ